MARKKKEETTKQTQTEETKDGRETNTSESGNRDDKGREYRVQQDGTIEFTGNSEARDETGELGGEARGNEAGSEDTRGGAKKDLLQRIRNKKHQGNSQDASGEHRDIEEQLQGASRGNKGLDAGDGSLNGTHSGSGLGTSDNEGTASRNNSDIDSNSSSNQSSRLKEKQKPKVEVGKLPPLPKADKKIVSPSSEPVLTKKESGELKDRLKEALKVFFQFTDKGIGMTTKNKEAKTVFIWSTIDNEELEVIVTALLESGQRSKLIASSVRNITRNYQKLQMGLILAPRFVLTVQHYLNNGFNLPFGGKN